MVDYASRDGAYELIAMIEKYWAERGYRGLKAEVVLVKTTRAHAVFGVRSNMINGFPPREKVQ